MSAYAAIIAETLELNADMIDDIKAAGMLHDIGKLDISRDMLYKAARLTNEEYDEIKQHVSKGIQMLEPVGGSLRRVIPIILAHHDKFDGSGYHPTSGEQIPIESRIITVADVYDFADERSPLPQSDVAIRCERHHREGRRHRIRSESGRGVPEGVPAGQARNVGRAAHRRLARRSRRILHQLRVGHDLPVERHDALDAQVALLEILEKTRRRTCGPLHQVHTRR